MGPENNRPCIDSRLKCSDLTLAPDNARMTLKINLGNFGSDLGGSLKNYYDIHGDIKP